MELFRRQVGGLRGRAALWGWLVGAAYLLAGCAAVPRQASPQECEGRGGYERGLRDASEGRARDGAFARLCPNPGAALAQYRQGYSLGREKTQAAAKAIAFRLPQAVKEPSWVCEVESSSKIFTGVGFSEVEATRAAQSTCSSHFQARSCERAECKIAN